MARRFGILFSISLLSSALSAAPPERIPTNINVERRVILSGHVRTLPDSYLDDGAIPASQRLGGLTMYFKPSSAQSSALDRLLADLHNPASPRYHDWLTPEEYADQFGINSFDLGKIRAWLESQGLHVGYVGRGRSYLIFDGAAAEVEAAFQAGIHRYRSPTAVHYANSQNPSVPEAFQDVVGSIGGLDDFRPEPVHRAAPRFTSNGVHTLAPGDLATIYDFQSLLGSGIDGTGQKLAIAGESDLIPSDISLFRSTYNLPVINLQQILVPNMSDPGVNSTLSEADLDIEISSSVARNATILYVYSPSVYDAVTYVIDQALAPVVNASYHMGCDTSVSAAEHSSLRSLAQQGNAVGVTWVNSSGDIGSAGCDSNGEATADLGLVARFPADIPEVTAVGGTEFNEQNGIYWSASNSSTGGSALSYIPEVAWNDNSANRIAASSGGVSTFPKPYWQTGPGVPNDGLRDYPDVALSASSAHDGYDIIYRGAPLLEGGTSSSAPLFTGIVTLVNHYLAKNGAPGKPGVGNLNILLYSLAQSNPNAFHDITSGNNIVPCTTGSPNCTNGKMGYTTGPGYDLVTGLGSLDVANLAAGALHAGTGPILTIASSHTGSFMQGQLSATYTITVTNLGYTATGGMVTVTDVLPAGLTLSSMAGAGWTCSTTCTRSDALAVATSYPVITVTVSVAANAPSSVTNMATVSGGGSPAANASDITAIAAAPLPGAVTIFSPAQGATGVSVTPTLTWTAATGATSYDVYFSTAQTPPFAMNTTGTSYTPAALNANTTYYWYLVSKNASGSTPSAVWSFTTAASSHPAFFNGEVSLGGGVNYLQFSDTNVFGYYNYVASSIFYHYDMGYEAFVPGSGSDIYLYDFTSSHWLYTSSTLFPYLYDFTLNSWLYYIPDAKNMGHYTANPRYFSNLTTGKIFTM